MSYKYLVATTEIDLEGERFTPECLREMAKETTLPLVITDGFQPGTDMGKVTCLAVEEGDEMTRLVAEMW